MTLMTNLSSAAPSIGGLRGAGPGIAGYTAWIIAAVIILVLVTLAWWTMRPARRASRSEIRSARRTTQPESQHSTEISNTTKRSS